MMKSFLAFGCFFSSFEQTRMLLSLLLFFLFRPLDLPFPPAFSLDLLFKVQISSSFIHPLLGATENTSMPFGRRSRSNASWGVLSTGCQRAGRWYDLRRRGCHAHQSHSTCWGLRKRASFVCEWVNAAKTCEECK